MAINVKGVFYFGDKPMEEWRDIPGYEGLYQVSSLGRIRSLDRQITQKHVTKEGYYTRVFPGKLMHPFSDKKGYQYVSLSKNGITKRGCVHVLVLQAFISKRPKDYECNHLNAIKGDNRLDNLEYCTKSENVRHSYNFPRKLSGVIGDKHHKAKLTNDDIKTIRFLYSTGKYVQKQLAEMFHVTQTNISVIVRGNGWKHLISN